MPPAGPTSQCPAKSSTSEVVECLLRSRAFFVKRVGESKDGSTSDSGKGQYTWSKYGGAQGAWDAAKKAAAWEKAST